MMRVNNVPIAYYKRGMPNICQVNPRNGLLREEGKTFCGPASVANALIWLAKNHFQMLVPPVGDQSERTYKLKLVEELAELMDSDPNGTSVQQLISGLRHYVKDRGYEVTTRRRGVGHNEDYHCGELTSTEWLIENLLGTSNLILDLEVRESPDYYHALHYVTGAGFNRRQDLFYVHDPSPSARVTPTSIEIEEIDHTAQYSALVRRYGHSENFFKINEYSNKASKWLDNIGVLIGAIAFRVFR